MLLKDLVSVLDAESSEEISGIALPPSETGTPPGSKGEHLFSGLREKQKAYLERCLAGDLSVAELVRFWPHFSEKQSIRLMTLASRPVRKEIFRILEPDDRETLIRKLSKPTLGSVFNAMNPDDLVDLIQSGSEEIQEAVWAGLSEELKEEIRFLLRFEQDEAAGLMTSRYAAVKEDITVFRAIAFLRSAMKPESISSIYVLDHKKELQGVVTLRKLLLSRDEEKISDIMNRSVIAVEEHADPEDTARIFEDNNLMILPVVNAENRLLGIITVDDILSVIRKEETEDTYRMGGIGGEAKSYLNTGIFDQVKSRLPWLLVLLVTGTLTSNILSHYRHIILSAGFLTLFIPVITQTGGNAGTQSSTLIIRALSTGEIHFRDIRRTFFREILTGLIIGLLTGVIIFIRSRFFPPVISPLNSLIVGLALSGVVMFATVLGALVPLLLSALKLDPTVAAGPLMSTLIDVAGLTIYFKIASVVLGL